MRNLTLILVAALCMPALVEAQQASDDCRDLDVVNYKAPTAAHSKQNIIIKKATDAFIPPPITGEGVEKRSPQGTARLVFLEQPDFTKQGKWTTKARIVGNTAHPVNMLIEIPDHANQDVLVEWMNEKLIFMRIWWGRLVSTDLILNVETGVPLYLEQAEYHDLVIPCEEKRQSRKR